MDICNTILIFSYIIDVIQFTCIKYIYTYLEYLIVCLALSKFI